MSLPTIRADWAQHMIYGSWIGGLSASAVLIAAEVMGDPALRMVAPAACVMMALAAGIANELHQLAAKTKDWDRYRQELLDWTERNHGRPEPLPLDPIPRSPEPHDVDGADVTATVLGAVPVAVPLFMMVWG